jgi:hypothetical protein
MPRHTFQSVVGFKDGHMFLRPQYGTMIGFSTLTSMTIGMEPRM